MFTLEDIAVKEGEVLQELKSWNTGIILGPDKISSRILQNCTKELAPTLTSLFCVYTTQYKWPSTWQEAHMMPIHKRMSRSEINK